MYYLKLKFDVVIVVHWCKMIKVPWNVWLCLQRISILKLNTVFYDIYRARLFLTKKIDCLDPRQWVMNNNFEKGKRGNPIWFHDPYYKWNYRGGFVGLRSISDELFSSRKLFEWNLLPFFMKWYIPNEKSTKSWYQSSHNVRWGKQKFKLR